MSEYVVNSELNIDLTINLSWLDALQILDIRNGAAEKYMLQGIRTELATLLNREIRQDEH